ncbi:hypothetical protein ACOME3_002707 [Neoechinorhynchus agilis]
MPGNRSRSRSSKRKIPNVNKTGKQINFPRREEFGYYAKYDVWTGRRSKLNRIATNQLSQAINGADNIGDNRKYIWNSSNCYTGIRNDRGFDNKNQDLRTRNKSSQDSMDNEKKSDSSKIWYSGPKRNYDANNDALFFRKNSRGRLRSTCKEGDKEFQASRFFNHRKKSNTRSSISSRSNVLQSNESERGPDLEVKEPVDWGQRIIDESKSDVEQFSSDAGCGWGLKVKEPVEWGQRLIDEPKSDLEQFSSDAGCGLGLEEPCLDSPLINESKTPNIRGANTQIGLYRNELPVAIGKRETINDISFLSRANGDRKRSQYIEKPLDSTGKTQQTGYLGQEERNMKIFLDDGTVRSKFRYDLDRVLSRIGMTLEEFREYFGDEGPDNILKAAVLGLRKIERKRNLYGYFGHRRDEATVVPPDAMVSSVGNQAEGLTKRLSERNDPTLH